MHLLFLFLTFIKSLDDYTDTNQTANSTIIGFLIFDQPGKYNFSLPRGRYKITCYGAQGGWSWASGRYGNEGGRGAMVSGYIDILDDKQTFMAIVGGQGQSRDTGLAGGGFNGGGTGGWCERYKKNKFKVHKTQQQSGPGGGGGCSEIRVDVDDILNRIIVAAGGSGASYTLPGAPGGNLTGFNYFGPSTRTTQTQGNQNGIGSSGFTSRFHPSSGGGAGYRGGLPGTPTDNNPAIGVADSGSSYISGFPGCSIHESIIFQNTEMVVGARSGNGLIQIDKIYECPPNCSSCSGPAQCKICDMPFRLYDGLCILECPDRTIDRYTYCEKCDPICEKCSKSATNCTDCYKGFYFYKNQCLDNCPSNTYEYEGICYETCPKGTFISGSKCINCDISCEECVDTSTNCIACYKGEYLFNNKCIEKCPDRTVRDGNICKTECQSGQYIYDGYCYTNCPKGTYGNGMICDHCDPSCLECNGTATTCTNCQGDSYLQDNKCIESCTENDFFYHNICVKECPNNTYIDGLECVDVCPKGKYGDVDNTCKDCDSSCASCMNSSTFCTSCHSDEYFLENKCLMDCINGTYKVSNFCVYECPSGTYPYGNVCQIEVEYYSVSETVIRKPKISNGAAIASLTIMAILCTAEISFLIYCFVFKKD